MRDPLEWGNFALIAVGIALLVSGPIIVVRTIQAVKKIRHENPKASVQPFNNGFNLLIGLLFFGSGILFILNNLRGNPLH
jgi:4-hydroxybenzoate polyprenyltransferase